MEERWDPIKVALNHMIKVNELVERCSKGETGEEQESSETRQEKLGGAISTRARDLPGLIASAGLVPALTFYMSKSNEQIYTALYKYILEESKAAEGSGCGLQDVKDEDLRSEFSETGKGYTVLLALSAVALKQLGFIEGEVSSLQDLAKALLKLHDSGGDLAAERILLDYLIEVKKLAEAFYGGKARE